MDSGNGRLGGELPNREVFYALLGARTLTEQCRQTYYRIWLQFCPDCQPPALETVRPENPGPVLVGLTWKVVQPSGAGHR